VGSDKADERSWRRFEELVARIERTLGPRGAVVKCPDHIPDKFTGQLREVDASVRFPIGTVEILITIECRDRSSVQDVTWIEQLPAKKDAVGAAKTVAVSSSGFTQPAIERAESLGIEVRQITEITDDDIFQWFPIKEITTFVNRSGVVGVHLILEGVDQPEKVEFDKTVQDLLGQNQGRALVFTKRPDGEKLSLDDLINKCKDRANDFFVSGLPDDGSRISRTLKLTFPPQKLFIQLTSGPCAISALLITFELFVERSTIPISGFKEYSNASSTLAYVGEATTQVAGNKVTYLVVQNPNTPIVRILVSKEAPPGAIPIEFVEGTLKRN